MEKFDIYSRGHIAQANLTFIMEQIVMLLEADTKNCKVLYLSSLLSRARVLTYPHTKGRSFCPEWDRTFSYVLLHSVAACIPTQAWLRNIKEIMYHDLEECSPHDGSAGHVVHLFQVMKIL